ncbi:MAG: hypothetical protein KGL39_50985 [Patescibacteria group bacterium]|nr:hypothetical protein [Patescibacteria group bacterium]
MIKAIIRPLADTATPALDRLMRSLRHRTGLARAMAHAVQYEIRTYARDTDSARHATADALGATPSGFLQDGYALAAQESALEINENGAAINLPRAQFARAFADVNILPGGGRRYLTFAARAEAYNRRARSFDNLKFGMAFNPKFGRFCKALIEAPMTRIKLGRQRRDGTRRVRATESTSGHAPVYWLVSRAHQKQDRSLLPTGEAMVAAAREGAQNYLNAAIAQRTGS